MNTRVMAALSVSLALATGIAVPQDGRQTGVIFENVRIFNGTSDRLSVPSNVLVIGNVITSISTQPIAAPAGATVVRIPGGGRTLMPGLIDAHVHMTFSVWSQREMQDPGITAAVLEARAAEGSEAMLMRGFTAVRDMGGPIFKLKAGIDSGKYKGPRIWPSGAMV